MHYVYTILCAFCFCRANLVIINGTKYQTPCALVVGKTEQEDPILGSVCRYLAKNYILNLRKWKLFFTNIVMHIVCPLSPTSIMTSSLFTLMVCITVHTFQTHFLHCILFSEVTLTFDDCLHSYIIVYNNRV